MTAEELERALEAVPEGATVEHSERKRADLGTRGGAPQPLLRVVRRRLVPWPTDPPVPTPIAELPLEERERERMEWERRDQQQWVDRCNVAAALPSTFPSWLWANTEDPEVKGRIAPRILAAAQRWTPSAGNLVLTGPTGCGKTAGAIATCRRSRTDVARAAAGTDRADREARAAAERQLAELQGWRWITGHEIARARREASLGVGLPEPIAKAMQARVLVIDEIGQETPTSELWEVVDARYAAGLATIATTGLTPAQFRDKYGTALWRRLADRGSVIDARSQG